MRFIVPFAEDDGQADIIRPGLRGRPIDLGLPATRRRIHALSLADRRPGWRLEIGDGTPDPGEPVPVMLESSDLDLHFIFTPDHGLRGDPYPWPSPSMAAPSPSSRMRSSGSGANICAEPEPAVEAHLPLRSS